MNSVEAEDGGDFLFYFYKRLENIVFGRSPVCPCSVLVAEAFLSIGRARVKGGCASLGVHFSYSQGVVGLIPDLVGDRSPPPVPPPPLTTACEAHFLA